MCQDYTCTQLESGIICQNVSLRPVIHPTGTLGTQTTAAHGAGIIGIIRCVMIRLNTHPTRCCWYQARLLKAVSGSCKHQWPEFDIRRLPT